MISLLGGFILMGYAGPLFAKMEFYKYQMKDVNFLPIYIEKLENEKANENTHFRIELNDYGNYQSVSRIVHGKKKAFSSYTYNKDNILVWINNFNASGRSISKKKYFFADNIVKKVESYSPDGKLFQVDRYGFNPEKNFYFINEFTPEGKKKDWFEYWLNDDRFVYKYNRHITDITYYDYRLDEKTGLAHRGYKYKKKKLVLRQEYEYHETGIDERVLAYIPDVKSPFAQSDYEEDELKVARYFLKDGTEYKRYEFIRDERDVVIQRLYFRFEKQVAKFRYEYNPDGTIDRTLIYDKEGDLVYEYPHKFVEYVFRDASSKDGMKGGIQHKKTHLW